MNRYPTWKYLLIILILVVGFIYALPNLYGEQPSIHITGLRGAEIDQTFKRRVVDILNDSQFNFDAMESTATGLAIRFTDTETQLKAQDELRSQLGESYAVALNLMPSTPGWLAGINAAPMYLGLDLRGGVYLLIEVDMETAVRQGEERYVSDIRDTLRNEKIRYLSIGRLNTGGIEIKFRKNEFRDQALDLINDRHDTLILTTEDQETNAYIYASLSENEVKEIKQAALKQNVVTLRNRVNELGVAEPVVQQQGDSRIVAQLPGVQDPNRIREILSATASLEYRMVDQSGDVQAALEGRVPIGSRLYRERDGTPILLKKRIIVTGNQVIDAASGIDQQTGSPAVYVTLDSKGAKKMGKNTIENIGKDMAVVYIENKTVTREVDGEKVKTRKQIQEVISVATIRDSFSKRFQTTGLDSTTEARNLALLLRAGALAAPIEIVEERTIGPSLGQDNIDKGLLSVELGFVLVLIFMVVWYRLFGLVANLALTLNLVMIVAVLSMLQATLTLPGIAGIVLTVGMAVDANVLIFERIREELRNGNSPQSSINAGYSKALSTIADANITTLIAAIVLYGFGTGPIKGFAITLSIGIITSMFTAIMGTRAVINLIYGGKRVERLAI